MKWLSGRHPWVSSPKHQVFAKTMVRFSNILLFHFSTADGASAHSFLLPLSAALLWVQRWLLTDCQSAIAAGWLTTSQQPRPIRASCQTPPPPGAPSGLTYSPPPPPQWERGRRRGLWGTGLRMRGFWGTGLRTRGLWGTGLRTLGSSVTVPWPSAVGFPSPNYQEFATTNEVLSVNMLYFSGYRTTPPLLTLNCSFYESRVGSWLIANQPAAKAKLETPPPQLPHQPIMKDTGPIQGASDINSMLHYILGSTFFYL